ncbi:MAG: polysaccharide biosynthesis protein [Phycisphaeraceae bacterium]
MPVLPPESADSDHEQRVLLTGTEASLAQLRRQLGSTLESLNVQWEDLGQPHFSGAGERAYAPVKPASAPWALDPVQLLGRTPHPLDESAICRTVSDRVVLITGAGGSIGSELARIVCRFGPSRLVLVERSENALFEIDREIARRFPDQPRAAVLHDVTDAPRTLGVITAQKPAVIFHAAAHKHVPMMEDHPAQAVENNFYGTRSLADAAAAAGCVDRFVMISTDKAVRPSSVMGASKRLAELYIQYLNSRSDTIFSMVRFGNVLGSACSVIPIWTDQLAHGGPITVTHPDMQRYFMTIPEAAGLVVQSAAFAGAAPLERGCAGGEVFLLDMGQPIRILDLAKRFVRRNGLEPGRDIQIKITGIRPGEKLFEELAYDSEAMLPTPHPSVRLWRTTPPAPGRMRQIIEAFDELRGSSDGLSRHLWQHATRQAILSALKWAVPEMVAPATAPTTTQAA